MLSNANSTNRIFELDFFKIVCCILVIVIHSYGEFLPHSMMGILDALTAVAVPGFMMVSGYLLFFTPEKKYDKIIKGPILRFCSIFIIWFLVYIYEAYMLNHSVDVGSLMLNNSEGWHLWYIKIYIQILICYPIIKCITNNEKVTNLFSVLWMIFIGLKYSLNFLPNIPQEYFKILQLPFFEYDGYIGGTTAGYHPAECLGIFVLGGMAIKLYFQKKKEVGLKMDLIALIVVLASIYMIVIFQREFENLDLPVDMVRSPFHIYNVIFTLAFGFCCFRVSGRLLCLHELFEKVSNNCLGVYIIHPLVQRMIVSIIVKNEIDTNRIGVCAILFVLTVIVSFFIVQILHKIVPQKILKYVL